MKPSDFMQHPYNSILKKSETETVARNIMVILAQSGDEFRELSWEEYKWERQNGLDFSESEKGYFNQVLAYCESSSTAALFSPVWLTATLSAVLIVLII